MADNVERVLILSSRLKVVIEIIGFKKKQEKLLNNLLLLVLPKGLHRKIPKHPTPPTMYRQQPKWVKSAFGKSLIISLNQAGYGHWAVI